MSLVAPDFARPSELSHGGLVLQTAGGATQNKGACANPQFFTGFVTQPEVVARGLLAVADVAAAR